MQEQCRQKLRLTHLTAHNCTKTTRGKNMGDFATQRHAKIISLHSKYTLLHLAHADSPRLHISRIRFSNSFISANSTHTLLHTTRTKQIKSSRQQFHNPLDCCSSAWKRPRHSFNRPFIQTHITLNGRDREETPKAQDTEKQGSAI